MILRDKNSTQNKVNCMKTTNAIKYKNGRPTYCILLSGACDRCIRYLVFHLIFDYVNFQVLTFVTMGIAIVNVNKAIELLYFFLVCNAAVDLLSWPSG